MIHPKKKILKEDAAQKKTSRRKRSLKVQSSQRNDKKKRRSDKQKRSGTGIGRIKNGGRGVERQKERKMSGGKSRGKKIR